MASARRSGVNEQIATYGNCTRDHTSIGTWESATGTDHVADNETDVLECYDDSASFDEAVAVAGATNDATRFRLIRSAGGEGHDGTSNNGVYFKRATTGSIITITETFSALEDLIGTYDGNEATTRYAFAITGASTRLVACIAFDGANAGSGLARGFHVGADSTQAALCLAENNAGANFRLEPGAGNTCRAYNCIGIDNTAEHSFENVDGTAVLKNCLSDSSTGTDFEGGTYTGSDYNAAGDTSDPDSGAHNRTSQTFTFVNKAGNDYHLASNDGGALHFGQDLGNDATFAFTDDIDGSSFGTWSIGFDADTSSARRVGANEQVTTYGNCTRTYTDLATWEIDTDTDHVSDAETDVLECFDDSASFDDQIIASGSTNDQSFFRIIRSASGQGHDGTSNNGVYFNSTVDNRIIEILETFFQTQDLIFTLTINSANARACIETRSADASVIGCIAFDGVNSGAGTASGFLNTSADASFVICLAENNDLRNFASNTTSTTRFYNCISVDAGVDGWRHDSSGAAVCKNCLSTGSGTGSDFETGTYTGSNNNSSGDTTDPDSGSENRTSQTFIFVNAGGNDYHITYSDLGAHDFGQDLSQDADFPFDDDIDATLWDAFDIGFSEPGGPFVRSRSGATGPTVNSTSHLVTLPAGRNAVVAGDTIVVTFSSDGSETITWPNEGTEWIELFTTNRDGTVTVSVAWKEAIGDEAGEVITVTTGTSEQMSYAVQVIGGAEDPDTTPPESVDTTGDDANPNPPSQAADTAADFLFIAGFGADRNRSIDAIPTNYDHENSFQGGGSNGASVATAERQFNTGAAEDPGTFTISATDEWVAFTLKVHPPPAVSDITRSPGVGALSLSGQTPSLDLGLHPGVGALVLGGLAPALDFELHPNAGALVFAGQAADRLTTESIAVPVGALVFGGQTPGLDFELHPGVGALVFAGQAPTRLIDDLTPVPAGALSLAGQTPTRVEAHLKAMGLGTLTFAGQAPEALVTVLRVPGTGALSLAGQAPVAFHAHNRLPAAGALVLAGQTPSLDFEVHPGAGALVFAGQAPVRLIDDLTTVPVGSLTLAGQTPTRVEAHLKTIPVGALVFAGQTPTVQVTVLRAPGVGTLVLVGQTPSLAFGVSVPVGTLVLGGQAPRLGFELHPGVGTLVLAGQAPASLIDDPTQVPEGTLVFAGQTPSLAFALFPAVGTLTFAGQAPTAVIGLPALPGAGALVFAGQVPSLDFAIQVPAGALVFVGQTPVIPGAAVSIAVPVGAVTFAGQTPLRLIDDPTPVPAGSLSLTGQTPTRVEAHLKAMGLGTLTFTGQAPTADVDQPIPVPVGALVFGGLAPTSEISVRRLMPVGTLTLAGQTPDPFIGPGLLGVGALTFTGHAPRILVPHVIPVPVFDMRLNGQAPNIPTSDSIAVLRGTLLLSGHQAYIGHTLFPGAGALAFAGLSPTVTGTQILPVGQLVLQGHVPTLVFGFATGIMGTGALVLQGHAPTILGPVPSPIPVPGVVGLTFTGHAPRASVFTSTLLNPPNLQTLPVRRERQGPFIVDELGWLFTHMVQIDLQAGVGLDVASTVSGYEPKVMLQWSDDAGRSWSSERIRTAGRHGKYRTRAIWRRLGRSRKRLYRMRVTDPVRWAFVDSYAHYSKGTS